MQMQRRKLTINFQSRSKLVIQRQSLGKKPNLRCNSMSKASLEKEALSKENDNMQCFLKIDNLRKNDQNLGRSLVIQRRTINKALEGSHYTLDEARFIQNIINLVMEQDRNINIENKLRITFRTILKYSLSELQFPQLQNKIYQALYQQRSWKVQSTKCNSSTLNCFKTVNINLLLQKPRLLATQSNLLSYCFMNHQRKVKSQCSRYIEEQLRGIKFLLAKASASNQTCNKLSLYQEELFDFAQELTISRFGACKYIPQSKPPLDIVEAQIQKQLRKIHSGSFSYILFDSSRLLLQLKQSYNRYVSELVDALNQRAQFSKAFLFKILQWKQNYSQRKIQLNNLKVSYCQKMSKIANLLVELSKQGSESARERLIILQEQIVAISQLFLMGNTIY